jgi:hypothetical protein
MKTVMLNLTFFLQHNSVPTHMLTASNRGRRTTGTIGAFGGHNFRTNQATEAEKVFHGASFWPQDDASPFKSTSRPFQ